MAKSKTPWFPLFADSLLLDEKLKCLNLEEMGALFLLWARMWRNEVKRGHLLLTKTKPIPDEILAYDLKIKLRKFFQLRDKFLSLSLLKKDKNGGLFSEKISNYKTKWELERSKQQLNGKKTDKNGNETAI